MSDERRHLRLVPADDEQPGVVTTCACGRTKIVHDGNLTFTAVRCPFCPPPVAPEETGQ